MATLPQLRPVSDLPFTLSFPQCHGTARRLFPLLDGSTEPEVKENQGQTMGEVLEQEANTRRDGFQKNLSQESLQTGSVVRNDLSRCNPIMTQRGETKQILDRSHTPFPASLLLLTATGAGNGACSVLTACVTPQVTVEEDSFLAHPTRDRAKIQHSRRPPTRGHLMAVVGTTSPRRLLG